MKDARIQLRVPSPLKKWAEDYSRRKGMTLTGLIQGILAQMKREDIERAAEVKVHEF